MMALIDLHRRPPITFAFSDRELELLREAVTLRTVDHVGMRRLCERVGNEAERERYAALIVELGKLREKLGTDVEEETTS